MRLNGFLLVLVMIMGIGISNVSVATTTKVKKYGDWYLIIMSDAFGEKTVVLRFPKKNGEKIEINCGDSDSYSIYIASQDPVGWTIDQIPVKYRIGDKGRIIKEKWKHDYIHDFSYKQNDNVIIKKMKSSKGHFSIKILLSEFSPSLAKFSAAIKALDANCKR